MVCKSAFQDEVLTTSLPCSLSFAGHFCLRNIVQALTGLENKLMVAGERDSQGGWDGMYTLLYFKWITNKDLLYSTGNSAQCYVAIWMGGESGENVVAIQLLSHV